MMTRSWLLILFALSGCMSSTEPSAPDGPIETSPHPFDSSQAGTLRGQVVWDGEVPRSDAIKLSAAIYHPKSREQPLIVSMPHYPNVDPSTRGVAGVVVFLRGVDPRRAKPWNHPTVQVEFHGRSLVVVQGKERGLVGFIPRGSEIKVVNRDPDHHMLRGGGADFFSLPLPLPNHTQAHPMCRAGIVDLTCGARWYWLHAHLFVVDHPYYARTDAEGRFTLDHVPAGKYDVVCWMPSWHVESRERDPEFYVISRVRWQPPIEQARTVEVSAGTIGDVEFHMSAKYFDGKR